MSDSNSEDERSSLGGHEHAGGMTNDRGSNEVIEDLTGEDDFSSDKASLHSLSLSDGTPSIKPRAYQMEMLEESLKRNIIVAADTGSGKTHIAVLRIIHELERMPQHQFIWFLAPTVALCTQQFEVLQSQITSVQIKCLKGEDGVDRWTSNQDWDAVLKNVKVVVSTFQILQDALSHAFVSMDSLALIVFDEAHNCVAKHPGAKIMKGFYHPRKSQGLSVPLVLGLTASPTMRSDPLSLSRIEETLDAVARTPTKHREELRAAVNLPVLSEVLYESLPEGLEGYTKTIASLGHVYSSLKISEDPYVLQLIQDGNEKSMRELNKVALNHKTWCRDQLKSLHATSLKICREMGGYGADWYISSVISKIVKMSDDDSYLGLWDVSSAEKLYVANALKEVELPTNHSKTPAVVMVSDKITKMIDTIVQESSDFRGIIFVETRAAVAVMSHILSIHPRTRDRYRIGTMVGTSNHTHRAKNVGELVDVEAQKHILSLFKDGIISLVIATSVLEEGIDIPACNVVVCFQRPANLKSFVQRRGRARKNQSKLVLMLDPKQDRVRDWRQLEADMRRLYEDEMRELQNLLLVEDSENHDQRVFRVDSTGALLDLDNAVSHLYHFCATLPAKEYTDLRPEFICSCEGPRRVTCEVTLPLSVHEKVRKHRSRTTWASEKNAMKDAAFEAYVSLYRAALVNDNLLPLLRHDAAVDELMGSAIEKRAAVMTVREQFNPWVEVAKAWASNDAQKAFLKVGSVEYGIYLPLKLPAITPFRLYWDSKTEFLVEINSDVGQSHHDLEKNSDTWQILQESFGNRFQIEKNDMVVCFSTKEHLPTSRQATISNPAELVKYTSVIKDLSHNNATHQFVEWLPHKPPIHDVQKPYTNYDKGPDIPHLAVVKLPRRSDFLHQIPLANERSSSKPYSTVIPISDCVLDSIPFPIIQFGRMIPSIIHRIEITLIAQHLSQTLLKDVRIKDLSLVVTAICASSANEATNYQRLEFLGDSILKTCTSIQIMTDNPLWHEGYLSAQKDRLVSNARLSRAAVETGLDRYIITKPFTGSGWRPMYIDSLLNSSINESEAKRQMSSKVLADVVEALIGAAMVDGGFPAALRCLAVFLPEIPWLSLDVRRASLYNRVPDIELPPTLHLLEELIGYRFQKKALLVEAVTHASCASGSQSLERLEFLGDSILDFLVVKEMWGSSRGGKGGSELSHFQMHLLRTAVVNADFLAWVALEWGEAVEALNEGGVVESNNLPTSHTMPLWRFLRHSSPSLARSQSLTRTRHAALRAQISSALQGPTYPWALLSRLQAQKFYSDMVESLIGAVWIDSGSLELCGDMLGRMGFGTVLGRILHTEEGKPRASTLGVWHPKEELGVLADWERVRYVLSRSGSTVDAGRRDGEEKSDREPELPGREEACSSGPYTCRIYVGDREVVLVRAGVGKEEVKTRAAEAAVRLLRGEKAGRVGDCRGGVGEVRGGLVAMDLAMDVDAGGSAPGSGGDAAMS